jgi:hypothetical protein
MALALPLRHLGAMRFLQALGIQRWEWRTCWRSVDFWLCVAVLLLPFGFLLLLWRREPARARVTARR